MLMLHHHPHYLNSNNSTEKYCSVHCQTGCETKADCSYSPIESSSCRPFPPQPFPPLPDRSPTPIDCWIVFRHVYWTNAKTSSSIERWRRRKGLNIEGGIEQYNNQPRSGGWRYTVSDLSYRWIGNAILMTTNRSEPMSSRAQRIRPKPQLWWMLMHQSYPLCWSIHSARAIMIARRRLLHEKVHHLRWHGRMGVLLDSNRFEPRVGCWEVRADAVVYELGWDWIGWI